MAHRPGDALGRYIVLDRLGEGAMGVVYAAYDPQLDRRVALKLIKRGGDASRLQTEARAMAKLSHPHVVSVFDVGTVADQLYVTMEYVARDMIAWLAEEPRNWRVVLDAFCQAGEGLVAAHGAGMIHRDFKPANVLVSADGRMQVTDFGLVAIGSVSSRQAREGTPAYMAPEQLSGRVVDARADQFAFAVSVYQAIYGGQPFAGNTITELRANVCSGRLCKPPPSDAPDWLWEAIERCFDPDVDKRYASMRELLDALEHDPELLRTRREAVVAMNLRARQLADEGRFHEAEPLLRQALAAAMGHDDREQIGVARSALADGRYHDSGDAAAGLAELGDGHTWREQRTRGYLLGRLGKHAAALAAFDAALSSAPDKDERAFIERDRAGVLLAQHRYDEAERAMLSAIEGVAGSPHPMIRSSMSMAQSELQAARGDYTAALESVRSALAQRQLLLTDGDVRVIHCKSDSGHLLTLLGHFDEARRTLEQALEAAEQTRPFAPLTLVIAQNLADLLCEMGAHDEALALGRRFLARADRFAQACEGLTNVVGRALFEAGRHADALPYFQRAHNLACRRCGSDSLEASERLHNVAAAHVALGHGREAIPMYQRIVAINEATRGADHPELASTLGNLAEQLAQSGDLDNAEVLMRRALSIRERAFGSEHPDVAHSLTMIANLHAAKGRDDLACDVHRRAIGIIEQALPSGAPAPDLCTLRAGHLLHSTHALPRGDRAAAAGRDARRATHRPTRPSSQRSVARWRCACGAATKIAPRRCNRRRARGKRSSRPDHVRARTCRSSTHGWPLSQRRSRPRPRTVVAALHGCRRKRGRCTGRRGRRPWARVVLPIVAACARRLSERFARRAPCNRDGQLPCPMFLTASTHDGRQPPSSMPRAWRMMSGSHGSAS